MTIFLKTVVAALLFTAAAGMACAAGGSGERRQARAAGADAASVVLGSDLEQAVALVSDVRMRWTYDPGARTLRGSDEQLDYPLVLSEQEWRAVLEPLAYHVLREQGTERPFSSPLNGNKERGVYYSRATGQPLFSSEDKYDSRSGWPSFTKPINPYAIVYIEDNSLFMQRVEVVDSLSGSHLGHVFPDGPAPTGQRYCINGAALVFVPEGGDPPPIRFPGQGP